MAGAVGYLEKPLNDADFVVTVVSWIDVVLSANSLSAFRTVRLLRIFRILRLVKHEYIPLSFHVHTYLFACMFVICYCLRRFLRRHSLPSHTAPPAHVPRSEVGSFTSRMLTHTTWYFDICCVVHWGGKLAHSLSQSEYMSIICSVISMLFDKHVSFSQTHHRGIAVSSLCVYLMRRSPPTLLLQVSRLWSLFFTL